MADLVWGLWGRLTGAPSEETMPLWQSDLIDNGEGLPECEKSASASTTSSTTSSGPAANITQPDTAALLAPSGQASARSGDRNTGVVVTEEAATTAVGMLLSSIQKRETALPSFLGIDEIAPSLDRNLASLEHGLIKNSETFEKEKFLRTIPDSEAALQTWKNKFDPIEAELEAAPDILKDIRAVIKVIESHAPSQKTLWIARGVLVGLTILGASLSLLFSVTSPISALTAIVAGFCYATFETKNYRIGQKLGKWKSFKGALKTLNNYLKEKRDMEYRGEFQQFRTQVSNDMLCLQQKLDNVSRAQAADIAKQGAFQDDVRAVLDIKGKGKAPEDSVPTQLASAAGQEGEPAGPGGPSGEASIGSRRRDRAAAAVAGYKGADNVEFVVMPKNEFLAVIEAVVQKTAKETAEETRKAILDLMKEQTEAQSRTPA